MSNLFIYPSSLRIIYLTVLLFTLTTSLQQCLYSQNITLQRTEEIVFNGWAATASYLDSAYIELQPSQEFRFSASPDSFVEDLPYWHTGPFSIGKDYASDSIPVSFFYEGKEINVLWPEGSLRDTFMLKHTAMDETYVFEYTFGTRTLYLLYLGYIGSVNLSEKYVLVFEPTYTYATSFLSYYVPPPQPSARRRLLYTHKERLYLAKYQSWWEENATDKWRMYRLVMLELF